MKLKVCHLTSAHPRNDVRIFLKECTSLAASDFEVSLIVADGKDNEEINNVKIINACNKANSNRFVRMTKNVWQGYKTAKNQKADIYHLHDPELLTVALLLKTSNNRVFFDAHEDLPKQLLDKHYINKYLRKILSKLVSIFEKFVCKRLSGIITATPSIADKFMEINPNTINVSNFPLLNEMVEVTDWSKKRNEICFIGSITKIRGLAQVVESLKFTNDIILNIAGNYSPQTFRDELMKQEGWKKIKDLGIISRTQCSEIMSVSKVGIVTFLPAANHVDAQPNKMFEYMSAGIPVIGSDFPLWKEIIEKNDCGLCVDPSNSIQIAEAINYLILNANEAERKGMNGRKAVLEKYNWNVESEKLINFYKK